MAAAASRSAGAASAPVLLSAAFRGGEPSAAEAAAVSVLMVAVPMLRVAALRGAEQCAVVYVARSAIAGAAPVQVSVAVEANVPSATAPPTVSACWGRQFCCFWGLLFGAEGHRGLGLMRDWRCRRCMRDEHKEKERSTTTRKTQSTPSHRLRRDNVHVHCLLIHRPHLIAEFPVTVDKVRPLVGSNAGWAVSPMPPG